MERNKTLKLLMLLLVAVCSLLASCGSSGGKIYQIGYTSGKDYAAQQVRSIAKMGRSSDLKGLDIDKYWAENMYQCHEMSLARNDIDERDMPDYHRGFIDGCIEGGLREKNKILGGNYVSTPSSSKGSSSYNYSRSGGLNFFGWILALIGAAFLIIFVPSLGSKEIKVKNNGSASESHYVCKPLPIFISLIGTLVAIVIVLAHYNCDPTTWTYYFLMLLGLCGAFIMKSSCKDYRSYVKKGFGSGLVLVLSWIMIIIYMLFLIVGFIGLIAGSFK